jgi:hypothetical protein
MAERAGRLLDYPGVEAVRTSAMGAAAGRDLVFFLHFSAAFNASYVFVRGA